MARQHLSTLDAAWLHMDAPDNPMVITGVLWFCQPLSVDALRPVLQHRLLERYPRFTQRVMEGGRGPCWEPDPHFHLDRHLHHGGLPAPGGQRALQRVVSDRMSTPLDLTMAPWQFDLLDGYRGGSALICRIHHCVADGISLARVLLQMTDEAAPEAPHAAPSWRDALADPAKAWEQARQMAHEGAAWARHPERLAHVAGLGAAAAREAERLLRLPADPPSALRQPLTVRKVAALSEPIALDAVKAIGRATRTTVNDVLVSVLADALHSHLIAVGTPVDKVRAFIPVNLRPLDEPVPRELGNRFSLVVLPLPVGPLGPLERLSAVHAEMEALKASPQAGVVWALLSVMGASPPAVESRIVDLMGEKASLIITNVPGPREPLTLSGTEVGGIMVWVPQSGAVGLGVSILSYAGEVTVGVCGDAAVVGDPDALVATFERSWSTLQASIIHPAEEA